MALSLMEAEEELRSTRLKANFQRLTRLLMRGGVRLLRETLDSIITPADLPLKLSDPATENDLKKAKTSKDEWKALYPSPGVYGKSTDFDITLIFRLLRTICGLTPPPGPKGWDNLPNNGDHSLVADLVRIKYYRNKVYGHKKTMEVSDSEFVRLWKEISEALLRIAANISLVKRDEWKKAIDDFLTNPLTPDEERCVEELDRWYKQDMEVKEMLVEGLNTLTTVTREGHDNIQEEVRCLRQEVQQSNRPISPVNITGPTVVIQTIYFNRVDVNTQPGLPFEPQLLEETGSERVRNIPITLSDQEMEEGADGTPGELQQNQSDPPSEITFWDVILSLKGPYELLKEYLRYKRHVWVRSYEVGSLLLTVECSSLQVLEELWEDYRSGHLNAIAQEILVTAEVLEKLGLDEVKLETFISEEEYEKAKQIFEFAENSDYLLRLSKVERENTLLKKEVETIKQEQELDKGKLEGIIIKLAKIMGASIDELKDKVRELEMTTTTKDPIRYGQQEVLESENTEGAEAATEDGTGRRVQIPTTSEDTASSFLKFTESIKGRILIPREVMDPTEHTAFETKGPIIIIEKPLSRQVVEEGSDVKLVFKCKAEDGRKLFYQWFKNDTELHEKNEPVLVLKSVTLSDFGWYRCRASSRENRFYAAESSLAQLDVTPCDGTRYKKLREIDPSTQEKIGVLLERNYGWVKIAKKYEMDQLNIRSLAGDPEAGIKTLEYLAIHYPHLTVYDFCKALKESSIVHFNIVNELLDHLSVCLEVSIGIKI